MSLCAIMACVHLLTIEKESRNSEQLGRKVNCKELWRAGMALKATITGRLNHSVLQRGIEHLLSKVLRFWLSQYIWACTNKFEDLKQTLTKHI